MLACQVEGQFTLGGKNRSKKVEIEGGNFI
jgi:hypothetical protein